MDWPRQIEVQLVGLTYHTPVTTAPVLGGVFKWGLRRARCEAGVDLVVATPGRLMDHMRQGITDFVRVQVLVLDEADRMMDMGFWPDVQRIMTALPPDRQTLLFSATLPGEIQRMARTCWGRRWVQVGKHGGAQTTTRCTRSGLGKRSTGSPGSSGAMRMARSWSSSG